MESVYCIKLCVGKMVGLATDTPKAVSYTHLDVYKRQPQKSLPMCRLSGEKRILSGNWRESRHEQDKTEDVYKRQPLWICVEIAICNNKRKK